MHQRHELRRAHEVAPRVIGGGREEQGRRAAGRALDQRRSAVVVARQHGCPRACEAHLRPPCEERGGQIARAGLGEGREWRAVRRKLSQRRAILPPHRLADRDAAEAERVEERPIRIRERERADATLHQLQKRLTPGLRRGRGEDDRVERVVGAEGRRTHNLHG